MTHNNITLRIGALFLFLCFFGLILQAKQLPRVISGKTCDEQGRPLAGVVIRSERGEGSTITNAEGEYFLQLGEDTELLKYSYIGYREQQVKVNEEEQLDVVLHPDVNNNPDEIVQLGYSSQLRSAVSGAVATVSGEELEKSPVANLTQSFAGRLSGLITQETYSELSRATTKLYVRGISAARTSDPLVIIDGIPCAYKIEQTLEYISANEIESVSVLKDASTQALYGIQGANGVIVITTKRGQKGKLTIKTRFDQSFQEVTTTPAFINSAEYAQLRNEAAYNDGMGRNYFYSDEEIEYYRSGEKPDLYPNNNWYDRYMKDFGMMQRFSVNASGGNDRIRFFSDVNLMHQGGQFKTDTPNSDYKTNANNIWVNYRTNVDLNINKYLKAFLRLSGNIKRERTPGTDVSTVYNSLFQIPSNVYGPVTPAVIDESTGDVLDEGGKVITTERVGSPTYGMLNRSGYYRHTVTNIYSQFGLDLDMSFLTKGLSMNGIFAYQTNSVGHLATLQNYERWMRTDDKNSLTFTKKGSDENTPLAYSKSHSFYYHLTVKGGINYKRDIARHHVAGFGYVLYQDLDKADTSSPWCLPYNRISAGAEATYDYGNRYFAKFDVGYSGSEQYASGNRYTWTPAVSVAWLASNEDFLNDVDWLSYLKLRASYGKSANDQSGLDRYSYLDNVTVSGGGRVSYLQYTINEGTVGNPNIEAEVSKKQNYGIDFGLFNMVAVSADIFKERMENMVVGASASIPLYQGIPLGNYPKTNTGIFENKGYDISVSFNKSINKDFAVFAGGLLSYARNKIINWNEALRTDDYAYQKWEEGFSYGQNFGFLVDYSNGNGFFNSQSEIDNSNLEYNFGTPRVGDLKYQDLNTDNIIDDRDKAPIGHGALPRVTYAFSGGFSWKSFELSFLFQGVGKYSSIYSGTGVYETSYDGVFGSLHRHAWTQERYENGEKITSPALALTKSVSHGSNDYYNYDRSYLRLKNVELSYSLPAAVTRAISAQTAKVILSGQNLITWDHMKSDDFGPEGSYSSIPPYRVYNIGVSVSF